MHQYLEQPVYIMFLCYAVWMTNKWSCRMQTDHFKNSARNLQEAPIVFMTDSDITEHHGISNDRKLDCLFNRFFRWTKVRIAGPLWEVAAGNRWMANKVENIFMSWCQHEWRSSSWFWPQEYDDASVWCIWYGMRSTYTYIEKTNLSRAPQTGQKNYRVYSLSFF